MTSFTITPTVNQAKEFMEIASDFERYKGVHVLKIFIEDNGTGMDRDSLQAFFDLGNSLRQKERLGDGSGLDTWPIGEKGHGTKVYFKSSKITVITQHAV